MHILFCWLKTVIQICCYLDRNTPFWGDLKKKGQIESNLTFRMFNQMSIMSKLLLLHVYMSRYEQLSKDYTKNMRTIYKWLYAHLRWFRNMGWEQGNNRFTITFTFGAGGPWSSINVDSPRKSKKSKTLDNVVKTCNS